MGSYQALRPEARKGHTLVKPNLKGLTVSSILLSLYDIMINNHFSCWYKINPEPASLIKIFAIYLLIEVANSCNETIYDFIDYGKAFAFTNRPEIIRDLVSKDAGSTFTKAVSHYSLCVEDNQSKDGKADLC